MRIVADSLPGSPKHRQDPRQARQSIQRRRASSAEVRDTPDRRRTCFRPSGGRRAAKPNPCPNVWHCRKAFGRDVQTRTKQFGKSKTDQSEIQHLACSNRPGQRHRDHVVGHHLRRRLPRPRGRYASGGHTPEVTLTLRWSDKRMPPAHAATVRALAESSTGCDALPFWNKNILVQQYCPRELILGHARKVTCGAPRYHSSAVHDFRKCRQSDQDLVSPCMQLRIF